MTNVPEPSIFTRIINREIPAEIIYEDEHSIVIPDKFPTMNGQLLVISKRQTSYINNLNDDEYQGLMMTVRKTTQALDEALNTLRTCIMIEGFEVPHVHVRLYPCTTAELNLNNRQEAADADLTQLAQIVRAKISTE